MPVNKKHRHKNAIHCKDEAVPAPSEDKRWRIISAKMRRHGHSKSALIETLHAIQEAFGYLDTIALVYVARALRVPLSRVYGVATFYSHFRLKPQGLHTAVICLGTACYIKGSAKLLDTIERRCSIKASETTADKKISIVTARCLGACGIAPAAVFDGQVYGNLSAECANNVIEAWMNGRH